MANDSERGDRGRSDVGDHGNSNADDPSSGHDEHRRTSPEPDDGEGSSREFTLDTAAQR